jgi:hypothetical protein
MILRFWSAQYVRHLEEEIAWLRIEMKRQEQRAEDAISQMLQIKTAGAAALPPRPLIADKERDVQQELAELMKDSEFSQAGT